MVVLLIGLVVVAAGVGAVVGFQRRNGNKGETPTPFAGVHDFKDNRGF